MYTLPLKEQAYLSTLLSQPHRYYHNIDHINFCLGQLEQVPDLTPPDYLVLTYAIWYHDAVYNPYSSKNEELSAALFRHQHQDAHIDIRLWLTTIEEAILETAHHTTDLLEPSFTTALMLDIDLAGLGQDWRVFDENSKKIRKEYAHVDDVTFAENRIKFLEKLKAKKSLYYTQFFHHKYEVVAQTNVDIELNQLYNR